MLASLLALGGNFNNGTNAGAFYFNCNNGFSNLNLNYGAHLLVVNTTKNARYSPYRLVKIMSLRLAVSMSRDLNAAKTDKKRGFTLETCRLHL